MNETQKSKHPHLFRVGMKQLTKTVKADKVTYGGDGSLRLHLDGELTFIAAPQKWDYVQREEATDERLT
jgi:hypothetical protein